MATTISVLSQKGGTGKTTLVRTLADVLGRLGLDVLAVDADPQGNLSDYFDAPPDASPTLADVLMGEARAADEQQCIIRPAAVRMAAIAHGSALDRVPVLARGRRAVTRACGALGGSKLPVRVVQRVEVAAADHQQRRGEDDAAHHEPFTHRCSLRRKNSSTPSAMPPTIFSWNERVFSRRASSRFDRNAVSISTAGMIVPTST